MTLGKYVETASSAPAVLCCFATDQSDCLYWCESIAIYDHVAACSPRPFSAGKRGGAIMTNSPWKFCIFSSLSSPPSPPPLSRQHVGAPRGMC